MSRLIKAAAIAAGGVLALGLAGPASAMHTSDHVVSGAWDATSYNTDCRGGQQGDPDGGVILTRLRGEEVRAVADEFQTAKVETRWYAEKYVGGVWVPLFVGPTRDAVIGDARYHPGDGMFHAPFDWYHFTQPRHPRFVAPIPTNGNWRLQVESVVYQEDGVEVAYLLNTTAECNFAGKR